MKLILTRHGETEENRLGIMQGHLPGKLSSEGIVQAEKLALRLKSELIHHIFSSDLTRAADTARIIVQYHPHATFTYDSRLREIDLGELTGTYRDSDVWLNPSGKIEPASDLIARANSLLEHAYSNYPDKTILFMGHGGINNALICAITGKDKAHYHSLPLLKNTSVSIFNIGQDRSYTIELYNCIKHLENHTF